MKSQVGNCFLLILMLAALLAVSWAQTSDPTPPAPKENHSDKHVAPPAQPAATAADVQELKDARLAQQQQIKQLSDLIQSRDPEDSATGAASGPESNRGHAGADQGRYRGGPKPRATAKRSRAQDRYHRHESIGGPPRPSRSNKTKRP